MDYMYLVLLYHRHLPHHRPHQHCSIFTTRLLLFDVVVIFVLAFIIIPFIMLNDCYLLMLWPHRHLRLIQFLHYHSHPPPSHKANLLIFRLGFLLVMLSNHYHLFLKMVSSFLEDHLHLLHQLLRYHWNHHLDLKLHLLTWQTILVTLDHFPNFPYSFNLNL